MSVQTASLPDLTGTPCTWYLQKNVEKRIKGLSIFDKSENSPDIVCSPGHSLIVNTTEALFSLGAPGMDIKKAPDQNFLFEVLSRGLTSPNVFACYLPVIGRYILYLWLIRAFVASGEKKL